jgi:hypothetical protein
MDEKNDQATGRPVKGPLTAIGIFLSVFGVAVITGIFFTHTMHGKVINLVCGGILLGIGLIAIYNDQFVKRENGDRAL